MSESLEVPPREAPPVASPPPLIRRAAPVGDADRIHTLDVIRGMAVFGILLVNIEDFALITDARYLPRLSGGEGFWNNLAWQATYVLADTKFITIFTLLFGAGIALGDQRRRATRERRALAYHRRMAFLALLGLAHGVFLWDGDILYYYAVCALFLYFAPRIPTPLLFAIGLLLVASYSFLSSAFMLSFRGMYSYAEISLHQAPWLEQVWWRLGDLYFHAIFAPRFYALDLFGTMMIGMALLQWGFLSGRARLRVYLILAIWSFLVGLALTYGGTGFLPGFTSFGHAQLFFWGSSLMSLGYISGAIAVGVLAHRMLPVRALASVGRMALTNYLMHSVICTTLFYGYGFGLYEKLDRIALLGVVGAICAAQLVLSPLWLRWFRFGPCEWGWRCVTYWQLQPLRRRPESAE